MNSIQYLIGLALTLMLFFSFHLAWAEDLTIGCSTDLSGPAAAWANFALSGAKVVFNDVNNGGGLQGKKINFSIFNDAYDPKKAIANFRSLSGTLPVSALLLDWGSPTSIALLPFLKNSQTLLLFPISGSRELRKSSSKNVFTLRPSTEQESRRTVEYVVGPLKITKLAFVRQDDSFGLDGYEDVEKVMVEHHHHIFGSSTFVRAEPKMSLPADTMIKLRPEAIYVQSNPVHAILFVSEMQKRGYQGYYIFPSIVGVQRLIDAFGEKADHMIVSEAFPLATESKLPVVQEFRKAMNKAGIHLPNDGGAQFLYEGYLSARVTVEALKRRATLRGSLSDTLLSAPIVIEDQKLRFDRQTHQANTEAHLYTIEKGVARELP